MNKEMQVNKVLKKGLFARVKNSKFDGYNFIGHFAHLHGCRVGRMTYIGSRCTFINTEIGSFCSIAADVQVIAGEHPAHTWVSTHPAFYSPNCATGISFTQKSKFNEIKYADEENRRFVVIGNDVWIGFGVKILNGVKIGDGAIIAAGAVVTKYVEPYTIVGGLPAKKIGQRFNDDEIAFLLDNKWWNKDLDWIRENSDAFENIEKYKNLFIQR